MSPLGNMGIQIAGDLGSLGQADKRIHRNHPTCDQVTGQGHEVVLETIEVRAVEPQLDAGQHLALKHRRRVGGREQGLGLQPGRTDHQAQQAGGSELVVVAHRTGRPDEIRNEGRDRFGLGLGQQRRR